MASTGPLGLLRKLGKAAIVLVEDSIERFGDPDGRRVMGDALKRARDRAAELALENAELHDRLEDMNRKLDELQDKLQFNGPTLYSDEVDAIRSADGLMDQDHVASWTRKHRNALQNLLNRSDKCPFTAAELQKTVHGIITGETRVMPWPDPQIEAPPIPDDFWEESEEVETYEGSFCEAVDNEGARIALKDSEASDDDIPF